MAEYKDEYCTVIGPDEQGLFEIETEVDGLPNTTFVDHEMLDFMLKYRKEKCDG
jgi:hypothetical protein